MVDERAESATARPDAQDWEGMRGHYHAKRTLELAACGNHAILLVGPPKAGKEVMARSLVTVLPGAPFIAPRPPNDSLEEAFGRARGGMLFLKRLEQWDEPSLALLREMVVQQPGAQLLVATTGYCPCGEYTDESEACRCPAPAIAAYQERVSATIDACFAIEVRIPGVNRDLANERGDEPSRAVRARVDAGRLIQYRRNGAHRCNSALSFSELEQGDAVDAPTRHLLALARSQLSLSPQQDLYVRQLARTCADLGLAGVAARHVAEAISYRPRWMMREG